jgi:flagellar basal body-associated protein FliL
MSEVEDNLEEEAAEAYGKSRYGWLWILIIVVLVAAGVFYVVTGHVSSSAPTSDASQPADSAPAAAAPSPDAAPMADSPPESASAAPAADAS